MAIEWPSEAYERLAMAVFKQLDEPKEEAKSTLRDVARAGADAGFGGFTYYRDTAVFYEKSKHQIWAVLAEIADSMGETPLQIIAGFAQ